MKEINILEIKFDFYGTENTIYPVILQDDKEVILIDCGYRHFLTKIKKVATEQGIDMSLLTKIIITHHDYDHMGSLADFKREYPHVQVISSIDDERYISGKEKSLRLQQAEAIYDSLPEEEKENAKGFQKLLQSIEPVNVDLYIKDKEQFPWCGGVEIIATPGHMPGHISVYHKESKTLISGDALVIENDELCIANPQYTLDMKEAHNSIRKLLSYDIHRIICYHGGVYTKNIKESLEKLL